jgi:signal transduction histidine kinase/ActR/RegA family two-component response regulator
MDETGEWVRTGPNIIANRTRYIINDFRADPEYRDRPYVTGYPHMVSYLEVPLVSPLGYVLGSYCVVDTKTRDYDNNQTIGIMNEIAAAIMNHLELMKMKHSRNRSERVVEGLSDFIGYDMSVPYPNLTNVRLRHSQKKEAHQLAVLVPPADSEGATSLDATTGGNVPLDVNLFDTTVALSQLSSLSSLNGRSDLQSPVSQDQIETPPTPTNLVRLEYFGPQNGDNKTIDGDSQNIKSTQEPNMPGTYENGFIGPADIKSTFFRAAATIRKSMNLDGLMFLDAVPSHFVKRADQDNHQVSSDEELAGPSCAAIVQCVVEPTGETSIRPSKTLLPEAILQRLIRRFPRGHILSADEFGPIDNGYGPEKPFEPSCKSKHDSTRFRNDVSTLFRIFPEAKYLLFRPLWHFHRECWYAAAIGWVSDPTQAMGVADVNLLSAFGNSAMAEISCFEAISANRAKSNFVSSISHELRSPLHGILASSELLRDRIADASLLSILDMLDSCGTMLLDTFNNLLDHTKISNARTDSEAKASLSLTDLSELVEDVIDAVQISHVSEIAFQSSVYKKEVYSTYDSRTEADSPRYPVLVAVNIERSSSWKRLIDIGAWKRIVMNIFGNALKYTESGHIEVTLRIVSQPSSEGALSTKILFIVEDTGRGMSSDFLKYQLFTPFSQEDTLSSGMGLGLSIVQQLVKGLGGTVGVKSSVGVGTRIEVLVPVAQDVLEFLPDMATLSMLPNIPNIQGSHLRGLTLCFITLDAYNALNDTNFEATTKLQKRLDILIKALQDTAVDALGMNVILGTRDCPAPKADVYFLDSILFRDSSEEHFSSRHTDVSPLVVLCSGLRAELCARQKTSKSDKFHLHHPLGPRNLASVISLARRDSSKPVQKCSLAVQPHMNYVSLPYRETMADKTIESDAHQKAVGQVVVTELPIVLPQSLPQSKTRHLLLVDDNPINIKLLTAVVRKLNHTFITASNGLEAVEVFQKSLEHGPPIDLVFMDVSMPIMNGFEATRGIRQLEKDAGVAACRVVVLTGLSSSLSRNEAFASGTDTFLTKPVKLDIVRKLVDQI